MKEGRTRPIGQHKNFKYNNIIDIQKNITYNLRVRAMGIPRKCPMECVSRDPPDDMALHSKSGASRRREFGSVNRTEGVRGRSRRAASHKLRASDASPSRLHHWQK